ncbi:MAG: bifunctional chorismate mutase/prephenate dehydrogenase [Myxococcales bacterium]|nr:bifunctional chorismate mutase/prephenate dehydrogenase [Myxococcales bacterium]MDH3483881.1 bifunctional chorismate mutase/prephenate dehydrogenase [Myxococcales bacterium]
MTDDNPDQTPLEDLRAALDTVDHELLDLLVRRMGIVADIAVRKREQRVRIRDLARERRVLDDRCARAQELGLPPDSIELVWRQLMLMSRERQAALRVEVPPDVEPQRIAIVGGEGGMGQSLSTLFSDLGHEVLIADLDTELTPVAASRAADVVIVSVPIRETRVVIEQVGPHVRPDALLMDVTSIKVDPMAAMLSATEASVLGTHPMFGPGVNTYQGQRVVICPGRGDTWLEWARQMFSARGLVITETTPEEHDAMMAIVQVLHHFKTQVLGLALSRLGVPLEDSLRFTSPAYLLETYVTGRHFAQSPELYGPIEMLNPDSKRVVAAFQSAAAALANILAAGDQAAFDGVFAEVRAFFGDFTDEALEQSRFLIDRLVELSAGRSST